MQVTTATEPNPLVTAASRALLARVDELTDAVAAAIEREEPIYPGTVDHDDLRAANRANLVSMLSRLAGLSGPGLAAPKATGRLRATQGVPLPAVLRAYRIGFKLVWEWLIEFADGDPEAGQAMLPAATDIWALIDDYSQALTAAYQDTVVERARRDARGRDAVLHALLGGELVDGSPLWDCAALLRLPIQGTFAVVAASSGPTADEAIPGIEEALASRGVHSAWRVELDSHVGVVALTPRFTVDRLGGYVAERTTGRVGISEPYDGLDQTPGAARQARLAAAAATPGSRDVVRYDQSPIAVLLASEPEVAHTVMQSMLGSVLALGQRERDVLLRTLRAWFAVNGSTAATAERLRCHRNTVRYRLGKVAKLTGHDLTAPVSIAGLYLALEAHRVGQ